MPGNFKKEDLRILKTQKALITAMPKLLEQRSFTQITVNDLCDEALVSRTAFYSHFNDKYDLLRHWLLSSKSAILFRNDAYEDYEKIINDQIYGNLKIIRNLTENANAETFELLCDFIFSLLDINITKMEQMGSKDIVFCKFCSGGIINYLFWQVKNNFPADLPFMNPNFYDILINFLNLWNAGQ